MRFNQVKALLVTLVFLLLFAGTVSAAWSGVTKLTNSAPINSRWANTAFDSNGNLHISYNVRTDPMEVWYMKLDNDGNKLVSEKQLTVSDGDWSRCPITAVDSSGGVHVVFCDLRTGNWEPYYVKLDNNGNPLTSEIRLGFSGQDTLPDSSPWPTLAIDSTDYVHVIWTDSPPDNTTVQQRDLYYAKLDKNGNIVVNSTRLTSTPSHTMSSAIETDPSGNVHVVWRDDIDGNYEIYYTKLDNNGNTLVSPTRMTNDAGDVLVHPWIVSDSSGNIGIVWPDDRTGNGDIYYMKLDNNGNKLTADIRLTFDAAAASSISDPSTSTPIDSEDNIHIAWAENRASVGSDDVYYMQIDIDGNILINDTRLTFTSSDKGRGIHTAIDPNDYPHVTWSDNAVGNDELYYTRSLPETYNIPLNQGWNQVSIPLEQDNWSVEAVLSSIEGNYAAVYAYICIDDICTWKFTTARNPLTEMDREHGYWIDMTAPDTLELTGRVPSTTTINIIPSWNLVGYPSLTTRNITDVLASINYTSVYAYIEGAWKFTTARNNPLIEMTPGYGYWIDANEAGSYEVRS